MNVNCTLGFLAKVAIFMLLAGAVIGGLLT